MQALVLVLVLVWRQPRNIACRRLHRKTTAAKSSRQQAQEPVSQRQPTSQSQVLCTRGACLQVGTWTTSCQLLPLRLVMMMVGMSSSSSSSSQETPGSRCWLHCVLSWQASFTQWRTQHLA